MERTIIEILILAAAVENLVFVLLYGSLFDKPRRWWSKIPYVGTLATCHLCLSFWVALFIVMFSCPIFNLILAMQGAARYIFMVMEALNTQKVSSVDIIEED